MQNPARRDPGMKESGRIMPTRTNVGRFMVALIVTVTAAVVFAASVHYKKGPFVADNGFTATATGSIAGLGNGNVIVTLSFPDATGTTTCTNPGGNEAAGQNPATPAATSGTQLITQVKNGTVAFSVTTNVPDNPTPQAAGCPNGQWTAAFDNITFGDGTLTIQQETFQGSGVYVTVLTTNVSLP
jgi:hypothetical protein